MGVQVREATYGADGNHLPSYSRQFISFEWGGKHIEDFNLLVVFDNARLEKTVYSDTTDITSVFEGRDGQLFWQSNLQPLTINFKLATDGMTARELDDFREYFAAGIVRQLKLTEKPNRYCWARVASAPSISLLPFEHRVEFEGETIKTSLYKGEIVLNFVADDPYWYADDTAYDTLNTTQRKVNCYEEELPYAGAFTSDVPFCFLGDNFMYNNNTISLNEGKTLETNTTYLLYNPSRANVFPKISFTFPSELLYSIFTPLLLRLYFWRVFLPRLPAVKHLWLAQKRSTGDRLSSFLLSRKLFASLLIRPILRLQQIWPLNCAINSPTIMRGLGRSNW